jgi:predicted MFS family arabinose efflux permease
MVFRALTGIFAASVMPISLAMIGDIFPVNERQGAIGTFMGISFLGQGLSMVIGGTIAYFLNWRGVFGVYAVLALVPTILLFKNYKSLPSEKHPDSKIFAPYIKLLGTSKSLFTYIIVLLEGIFIVGSFSYAGAYIFKTYNFNYFYIGLIMTAFGIMTVIGGRLSGKIVQKIGARKVLSVGLTLAALADIVIYLFGNTLWLLIIGVALLGLGFIFTHSTLLTRATEFAQKARGAAMSLVAFCFMGGGGVGTAIGGKLISATSLNKVFLVYGIALAVTLLLSFVMIRDHVVEQNEIKEEIGNL